MAISWLGIFALVALLYVVVSLLANPRTRPLIIAVGLLLMIGFGFLFCVRTTNSPMPAAILEAPRSVRVDRGLHSAMESIAEQGVGIPRGTVIATSAPAMSAAPAPAPPVVQPADDSITMRFRQPGLTVIVALGHAIVQGLTQNPNPAAEPAVKHPKAKAADDTQPKPPDWVKLEGTEGKMDDNIYRMSVCSGPFLTLLDCQRELPKKVQPAVDTYAQLLMGPAAAGLSLSDDTLRSLVRDQWIEPRTMRFGDVDQEMVSLHALVGFDLKTQAQIRAECQRLMIMKRVQGAAVILSGVLGVMVITWGGLKYKTARQAAKKPAAA